MNFAPSPPGLDPAPAGAGLRPFALLSVCAALVWLTGAHAAPADKTDKPASAPAAKKAKAVVFPELTKDEQEAEGLSRTLEGEVTGRSNFGLAVLDEQGEAAGKAMEYWLNYHQGVQILGFRHPSELQDGDRVRVTYKELSDSHKKILKSVSLVEKKPKELEPAEDEVAETEESESEEADLEAEVPA